MLSTRKYLFSTTILAGVLALAAPALAQTPAPAPAPQDEAVVDEIVVTGSRIRRDPTNAPTPLIQVSRETLLETGQSSVIDYLATIPALSNSVVPSDTTGAGLGDGGLSLANLRSLGSNRTLTLVNGRRHVGSNGGSLAVDVDTIPRLLIENIEIVTGGAASVYGADAVSGVLNFILRNDFEGVEIDANYGMINQDGQANRRISALGGINLFDDRLNLYAHAEYEENDEVTPLDIDWIERAPVLIGIDADPTNAAFDGQIDSNLFFGVVNLGRPRWGQTTLVNVQQPSPLNDPEVAFNNCFPGGAFSYSANCYGVAPGRTFWYDGATARPANFGQRIGNVGINRGFNIGGDGENPGVFSTNTNYPESNSKRFQVGSTFRITDNVEAYAEAKYIEEFTYDASQPTFFDIDLDNSYSANQLNPIYGAAGQSYDLRWEDNAFLPANVREAIRTNTVIPYAAPTATAPGAPLAPRLVQIGRHSMFGPNRTQENTRELTRYVAGFRGDYDRVLFVNDFNFDVGYTYGEVEVENVEGAVDGRRFSLASDAVFDTAGIVNGTPGQIVCRAQLLQARGINLAGPAGANGPAASVPILNAQGYGQADIDQCTPLNIFGAGNQSAEALEYVNAFVRVRERNEQEQALASVSGTLWDFWGAGRIGVALGAEYRREATSGVGRSADANGRLLFLNSSPDFPEVEYESEEAFAELSIPLFRDSFLGEYAELSGSYRYADYTTVGDVDVYGVNLIYRPIEDILFKTSLNTSVRVPDLNENFSPFGQTFLNNFADPCATLTIAAVTDATIRANRIANCTTLAQQGGFTFDFAGATATNEDDFRPLYTSGIAGVLGGNPFLQPEESESFTFSTVLTPRFIPNLSVVLDYYEIEITNVIAAVSAATAAANCVSGEGLNQAACSTVFRNNPTIPFGVGGPVGDPIGGFIQGSINYAKLETRGLDFTVNYGFDFQEMMGRNWGRLNYSLGGLWLIDQKQFLNSQNLNDFNELSTGIGFARVRMTSSLTYTPNDTWSINWTADFQTAQDIIKRRDFISNADSRGADQLDTGNFVRNDITLRWNVRDDLSVRAGVVNVLDTDPNPILGQTLFSNFDSFGRRFFVGLNFRPF